MVEVSLIGIPDDYAVVRLVEQLARDEGGALHWGQSNGLMTLNDLEYAYGKSNLDKWRAAQRALGGDTFTNFFMKRCGLAPTPLLRVNPGSLRFGVVPVGDFPPVQMLRITNEGSGGCGSGILATAGRPGKWYSYRAMRLEARMLWR